MSWPCAHPCHTDGNICCDLDLGIGLPGAPAQQRLIAFAASWTGRVTTAVWVPAKAFRRDLTASGPNLAASRWVRRASQISSFDVTSSRSLISIAVTGERVVAAPSSPMTSFSLWPSSPGSTHVLVSCSSISPLVLRRTLLTLPTESCSDGSDRRSFRISEYDFGSFAFTTTTSCRGRLCAFTLGFGSGALAFGVAFFLPFFFFFLWTCCQSSSAGLEAFAASFCPLVIVLGAVLAGCCLYHLRPGAPGTFPSREDQEMFAPPFPACSGEEDAPARPALYAGSPILYITARRSVREISLPARSDEKKSFQDLQFGVLKVEIGQLHHEIFVFFLSPSPCVTRTHDFYVPPVLQESCACNYRHDTDTWSGSNERQLHHEIFVFFLSPSPCVTRTLDSPDSSILRVLVTQGLAVPATTGMIRTRGRAQMKDNCITRFSFFFYHRAPASLGHVLLREEGPSLCTSFSLVCQSPSTARRQVGQSDSTMVRQGGPTDNASSGITKPSPKLFVPVRISLPNHRPDAPSSSQPSTICYPTPNNIPHIILHQEFKCYGMVLHKAKVKFKAASADEAALVKHSPVRAEDVEKIIRMTKQLVILAVIRPQVKLLLREAGKGGISAANMDQARERGTSAGDDTAMMVAIRMITGGDAATLVVAHGAPATRLNHHAVRKNEACGNSWISHIMLPCRNLQLAVMMGHPRIRRTTTFSHADTRHLVFRPVCSSTFPRKRSARRPRGRRRRAAQRLILYATTWPASTSTSRLYQGYAGSMPR
ncbi:unnamed protein product [Trichogramma brassicae]|uniref:Uncharacterized protein n=1 Tax=Trichogramma brassicae TaxID=86971 RepID=A0A6H5IQT4_9HYME|nr:unnamed protein product [Trichogramma brassicae]